MDNTAQLRESKEQLSASQEQSSRVEAELSQARASEDRLKRKLAEAEREAREKLSQMEEVGHYLIQRNVHSALPLIGHLIYIIHSDCRMTRSI